MLFCTCVTHVNGITLSIKVNVCVFSPVGCMHADYLLSLCFWYSPSYHAYWEWIHFLKHHVGRQTSTNTFGMVFSTTWLEFKDMAPDPFVRREPISASCNRRPDEGLETQKYSLYPRNIQPTVPYGGSVMVWGRISHEVGGYWSWTMRPGVVYAHRSCS
jgi:hypothetical protein